MTFPGHLLAGRPVFVTGHTGFKGSWLTLWLSRLGAKVTGLALAPPTTPSNFEASRVREALVGHHEADIRDFDALAKAMTAAQPDLVFHLAAQPLVREAYASPRETFEVNVIGTANVLESVRRLNKRCSVIVITSDKCYENSEGAGPQPGGEVAAEPPATGFRETDAMGGHDPYSASKGAAELVVASYRRSFFNPATISRHGVKVASARAGNVIGGGDWAKDRIVTDLVRCLSEGKSVPVRNPLAVRPWQHVLEPLSGYIALAEAMLRSDDSPNGELSDPGYSGPKAAEPRWCSAWNFGPGRRGEAAVQELVSRFCAAWGEGQWQDVSDPTQPHEASVLRLNIDKAAAQLNWRPRWSLDQAVARTAQWYRKYYRQPTQNMRDACLADLDAYLASAEAPKR